MLKKMKLILMLGVSIAIFSMNSFAVDSGNVQIPATVQSDKVLRVGLLYGSVKDTSPVIESTSGFNFGYYQSEVFFPLVSFQNSKKLTIYKNGTSENESLITSSTGSSPMVNGKYHIQIGAVQPTFEAIQPAYNLIKAKDASAFLAYDGGWRVYIGAYYTQAQYEAAVANVTANMMPLDVTQAPFNYTAFMVLENNLPVLLFATNTIDFGFQNAVSGSTVNYNKYKYQRRS